MTYIAQLSDGSNTQFFPRTRWDALLNVPSLVPTGAFKVTDFKQCFTAMNGSQIGEANNIHRIEFPNFMILDVYVWVKFPKLEAWKEVNVASFPKSILNGYTHGDAMSRNTFMDPTLDMDSAPCDGIISVYPRQAITAGQGTGLKMSYIVY